jgi:hypothetical protein
MLPKEEEKKKAQFQQIHHEDFPKQESEQRTLMSRQTLGNEVKLFAEEQKVLRALTLQFS